MSDNNGNGKSFWIGAFLGSIIGAAAALLMAPKPGRELRQDIGAGTKRAIEKADDLKDALQEKSIEYKEKALQAGAELKDKSAEWTKKAVDSTAKLTKEVKEKTVEIAHDVTDKTKEKAKEVTEKVKQLADKEAADTLETPNQEAQPKAGADNNRQISADAETGEEAENAESPKASDEGEKTE